MGVGCGGCWELLGGGEKGQGGDLVMEFMSAEAPPSNPPPRPDGIQKSKLHAELTGRRALEPPSITSPATPGFGRRNLGPAVMEFLSKETTSEKIRHKQPNRNPKELTG